MKVKSQKSKISKIKIKKGDTVKLLLGKDRGKESKVVKVDSKKGRILVEGVNVYKRHVKRVGGVEGGVIDLVKPVDISNVALVCPHCKKPTRVGFKFVQDKKVRVCKRCKKEISDVKS